MKVSVRMAIMSHLSDLQDRLRFSVNPSRSDRQTYIEVNRVKAMLNRYMIILMSALRILS